MRLWPLGNVLQNCVHCAAPGMCSKLNGSADDLRARPSDRAACTDLRTRLHVGLHVELHFGSSVGRLPAAKFDFCNSQQTVPANQAGAAGLPRSITASRCQQHLSHDRALFETLATHYALDDSRPRPPCASSVYSGGDGSTPILSTGGGRGSETPPLAGSPPATVPPVSTSCLAASSPRGRLAALAALDPPPSPASIAAAAQNRKTGSTSPSEHSIINNPGMNSTGGTDSAS
eukprot:COSAG05_NODE_2_length_63105_cov_159.292956_2_plen_232_part_00